MKNNQLGKRGVSPIVAYVLLIIIGLALSSMVYIYLKNYLPSEEAECPADTSLIISNVLCSVDRKNITVTLSNRGLFNVSGAFVRLASPGKTIGEQLNKDNELFPFPLSPDKHFVLSYKPSFTLEKDPEYTLSVQPSIFVERKLIPCAGTVTSQKFSCASSGPRSTCTSNQDCDDSKECTTDTCESSQCVFTNSQAGAECSAGGKVCDGSGKCVDCVDNAQCTGTEKQCDTNINTCKACIVNDRCESGENSVNCWEDCNPCKALNHIANPDRTCTVVLGANDIIDDGYEDNVDLGNGLRQYTKYNDSLEIYFGNGFNNYHVAYIEWNISSIPDVQTISNISLKYSSIKDTAHVSDTLFYVFPASFRPSALSTNSQQGLPPVQGRINQYISSNYNFHRESNFPQFGNNLQLDFPLTTQIDENLTSQLSEDWFAIGLYQASIGGAYPESKYYKINSKEHSSPNPAPTLTVTYKPA